MDSEIILDKLSSLLYFDGMDLYIKNNKIARAPESIKEKLEYLLEIYGWKIDEYEDEE